MTDEKISLIADGFKKNLGAGQIEELKEELKSVSDEKYEAAVSVKTKSTLITVLLSAILGLFGAGSFYIGRYKRGICKVVFNVVVPLVLSLVFLYWLAPLHKEYVHQTSNIITTIKNYPVYNSLTTDKLEYENALDEYKTLEKDEGDNDNSLTELKQQMEEVKRLFTEKSKTLLIYLNEYADTLAARNQGVAEAKANTVDNKVKLSATLASIDGVLKELETQNDLNEVYSGICSIVNSLDGVVTRSQDAFNYWKFSYRFQNIFFPTYLIITGIIMIAYWIGEVFADREKCRKDNLEKIKRAIE